MTEKEIREQGYYLEEENFKCPICNSKKIYNKNYNRTPYGRVFHSYKCRKCGWDSVNFDE